MHLYSPQVELFIKVSLLVDTVSQMELLICEDIFRQHKLCVSEAKPATRSASKISWRLGAWINGYRKSWTLRHTSKNLSSMLKHLSSYYYN